MFKKNINLMVLICAFCSYDSFAENCSEILKGGIHDTYQSTDFSDNYSLTYRNFCKTSDKNKDFNFSGKGTAIVGSLIAQSGGQLNYNSNEIESFCNTKYSAAASSTESRLNIKRASKVIAQAWSSCMESDGANFSYQISPDNKKIALQFKYRSSNSDSVKIKTRWWKTTGFNIEPENALDKNCKAGFIDSFGKDVVHGCSRSAENMDTDILITLNTKRHGSHQIIIPKEATTDYVPNFDWVRTDTNLIGTNRRGRMNDPFYTCLKYENFEGLVGREQSGFGLVNLHYTCTSIANGSNAKPKTTGNLNGTDRDTIYCPNGSSPRGITMYTQPGFGVIDMKLVCRNGKNKKTFSELATKNPNKTNSFEAECPSGQRFSGVQPRSQSGFGIINMKLICEIAVLK